MKQHLVVGRARKDPGLRHGAASSLAPAAVALVSGCGGAKPGASLPDSSVTTTPGESSGRPVLAAIGSYETYLGGNIKLNMILRQEGQPNRKMTADTVTMFPYKGS